MTDKNSEDTEKNTSSAEQIDSVRRRELAELEKKIGFKFRQIDFLNTALTHTSYANEKGKIVANNERLEFLGDAVLELASSTYLYENFQELSEGQLTKTRASIVCGPTLAKLAAELGLGKILRLGRGEDSSGGRTRESNLEDAFEAVIGAIYLDSGWEPARDYVIRRLTPEFEKVRAGNSLKDYKTVLQELIQKDPSRKIDYVELGTSGPDHMKIFEYAVKIDGKIYGKGKGGSKKIAEQTAAKHALEILDKK